ncbi:MAG TPA: Crp/Fnr family transcriptional regulator [Rubrobacteraceae bacterium]|nr:Crp/Fnr family transcriptional regulator [Rubrobacteraceae bacterium]
MRAIEQSKSQAERIRLLSMVDVLETLTAEETAFLAQRTPERAFQRGETVYAPGDALVVVFLLLTGSIRLYGMAGGQELTFDVLRAGTMFGIASLMERTQDEYAVALEPSRVGVLGLNDFWHLVRQNPEINARLVKLLGERLRMTRSRMADIALKETPARLASLILDLVQSEGVVTREGHYKIVSHYTHEQLGGMIGAKRAGVTRAFRKLQDSGCVRLFRRRIYVVDLDALKRWASAG